MANTDREILKLQQQATLASAGASDPLGEVGKAHQFVLTFNKTADDAMASTATTEVGTGMYLPVKAKLKSVHLLLTGATTLTGHASNYASIILDKYSSAGAGNANVLTWATDTATTDDLAVYTPKDISAGIVDTAAVCDAGSNLSIQITKTGSGVIVPALRVICVFEAV